MLAILGKDTQYYPHFIDKNFPHVMRRIVELWGQSQLDSLLNGLLAPTAPGCTGFPRQVLREIVDLRQLLRQRMAAGEGDLDVALPVRDSLWMLADFEQANYPVILESQYPQLLPEILSHLGQLRFNAQIDALLLPARQRELDFQEAVLMELMTLKALHGVRYFPKEKLPEELPVALHDGHADGVFERFHRR